MTNNISPIGLIALSLTLVGGTASTAAFGAKSTNQCEEELGEQASDRRLVMACLLEGNKDTKAPDKTPPSNRTTKAPIQNTNPVSRLRTKIDKIEGVTWYYDKSTPNVPLNSILYAYIGKATGAPTLRVYIQYSGSNWLFVQKALVVADERRFEVNGKWSTDHHTKVWEWNDHLAGPVQMAMLKAVASSKSTTIRFYGRQYIHDQTVTSTEKTAIKNILEGYTALGGK